MIHGKTKIELYNPNTKVKEIVRSENTFQGQNIASYMKEMGIAGYKSILHTGDNSTSASHKRPLWQTYVGGIFLFRDSIPANSKFMPSSNLMVGNGSYGVVNAEDVPEMGSWNPVESSVSVDDGITMVYDFNTAQANGIIGSICLTSDTGGYIGYGNASGKTLNSKYYWYRNGNSDIFTPITANSSYGSGIIYKNIYYQFYYDYSSKILTVRKTHMPVTAGHIFDNLGPKVITIDMSSFHWRNGNPGAKISIYNDKIYLCTLGGSNYSNGDTIYFWEYNPTNDTITEKSVVNNTGYSVGVACTRVIQGYLVCQYVIGNTTPYLLKDALYDISTGDLYDTADLGTVASSSSSSECFAAGDIGNGIIIFDNRNEGVIRLYDITSKTIRKTNSLLYTSNYPTGGPYYDNVMDAMITSNGYSVYVYSNPLYLATINNLQSPITKDSSHTMKITYTLTEV